MFIYLLATIQKMKIDYRLILEKSIKGEIIDERSGASGVIYIVDNGVNTFPRKVAYKSIRVDKLDNIKKEHFLIECDLWFKIPNSYLTNAFYPVIIDDLPFICMPYYELDLKALMLKRSFNKIEALVITCQLSKALLELQKTGVKHHQDFNPPNILIQDLSETFTKYPKDNCINYSIKITDFGMADLIERIGPSNGGGGGKFPFKAPEQYETKKYPNYSPDIFALGVMTYMIFTDLHPNHLTKKKALNKSTSSSEFKKWAFEAHISFDNKKIENIINKSLEETPSNRPTVEEFYNVLMSELSIIDKKTYNNLKFKLDFYDSNNSFNPISKEIHTLNRLSEFTHNKTIIAEKSLNTFQTLLPLIKTEKDVIRLCEYYKLSVIKSKNNDLLTKNSLILIDILFEWYKKIKVYHKYPSQEFNGEIIQKTFDCRDIEIVSEYVGIIYLVLLKSKSSENIDEIFTEYNDDIFYSILIYSKAILKKNSNIYECITLLNNAKELNQNEPLFDYMIYLSILHNSILNSDEKLEKIKTQSYNRLKENHLYWNTIKKL